MAKKEKFTLAELMQRQRKVEEQKKELENKFKEKEWQEWLATLTDEELLKKFFYIEPNDFLASEVSRLYEFFLEELQKLVTTVQHRNALQFAREHFEYKIWQPRLQELMKELAEEGDK